MFLSNNKIQYFFSLGLSEQLLIPFIFVLLGVCRLGIAILPFRFYSKFLGEYSKVETFDTLITPKQKMSVSRLSRIIEAVARTTPWESTCLVQAMTASFVLNRKKIPYVLYFGVAKNKLDENLFHAHAWVTTGSINVTGGVNVHQFSVVATYTSCYDLHR